MKTQGKRDMKERRPLIAGLTESGVDSAVERAFVHGDKAIPAEESPTLATPAPTVEAREGQGRPAATQSRMPLTSRARADLAIVLKRASLQRQLNGQVPNSLQDLLDEALEAWLRSNGYLN